MRNHFVQFLREAAVNDADEEGYVTFTMGEHGEGTVASFEAADLIATADLLDQTSGA